MTWEIPTMKELAAVCVVAFLAYWCWVWWNARTFAARSTRALLRAWDDLEPGSSVVFYRCRHNWGAHRATFFVLARTAAGQWFETEIKVLAVTKAVPQARRPLTPSEARAWLAAIPQAAAEVQKHFGASKVAA